MLLNFFGGLVNLKLEAFFCFMFLEGPVLSYNDALFGLFLSLYLFISPLDTHYTYLGDSLEY